jgi:hypothetical protein
MLLVSDDGKAAAGGFHKSRGRRIQGGTMNGLVLANIPLAILVILAIVGIPLWMAFKRPETGPDYSQARAHFGAKAALARAEATTGSPARAGRTPARLSPSRPARQHAAARTAVSGRRHADASA